MHADKIYPPAVRRDFLSVAQALERVRQTRQILFVEEIYLEHSALLAGLRADLDLSSEEVGQGELYFIVVARTAGGGLLRLGLFISFLD